MNTFAEFTIDLETFIVELTQILDDNEKKVEELLAKENKSYANFVKPLQMMDEALEIFFTPLSHLNSVSNTDTTQKVYSDSLPIITEYSTKLSQNLEIYSYFVFPY